MDELTAGQRAILAYCDRASESDSVFPEVLFHSGAFDGVAHLHAQRRPGQGGNLPAPLVCDAADVRRLIAGGYLTERGPFVTIAARPRAALGPG
jgi:hypothetical protein